LIEIVGDGDPRLMIEHDRTRLTDPCFFSFFDVNETLTLTMKRICCLLLLAMLATGCSWRYVGQPKEELLSFQTYPTYGKLYDLAYAYGESLNAAIEADTLHPGMYADYGVVLALMGHQGEACRMLNAEAKAFPQSRKMVDRLKQRLMPEMLADTFAPVHRDTVNMVQLQSWGYDSVTAMRTLPYMPPVIDSSDTARIRMQTPVDSVVIPIRLTANQKREMLAQEQKRAELEKQAVADSIALAKLERDKARKQAKMERDKAKKESMKAKKKANKEKKKAATKKSKQRKAKKPAQKQQAQPQAAPADTTSTAKP